jgi:hypothetical protein
MLGVQDAVQFGLQHSGPSDHLLHQVLTEHGWVFAGTLVSRDQPFFHAQRTHVMGLGPQVMGGPCQGRCIAGSGSPGQLPQQCGAVLQVLPDEIGHEPTIALAQAFQEMQVGLGSGHAGQGRGNHANPSKGPGPAHTCRMYRTHTCGELRLADAGKTVTLAGWVQRTRDLGGMTFVDLRDRYGITQLTFNTGAAMALVRATARTLGREFVVQVTGTVVERESKNKNMPTGEVEIVLSGAEGAERREDAALHH